MSKRTWSYRLIRHHGTRFDIDWYNIHSVHYDDGEPVLISAEPVYPQGDDIEEFKEDFELYSLAILHPVLNYSDFEEGGKYYGKLDEKELG